MSELLPPWFLPLQHHDPSFSVSTRFQLRGYRIHPREGGLWLPGKQTYGDVIGSCLWPEVPGKREHLNAWFFCPPGVVAMAGGAGSDSTETTVRDPNGIFGIPHTIAGGGGGSSSNLWLPMRKGPLEPDDRLRVMAPALPPHLKGRLPKGTIGIVTVGTDELGQHETVHPTWSNMLVAVNKAGDPACGTLVYDLEKDGSPGRNARLQSIFSVQDVGGEPVIGLQIGKGGRIDAKDGYLLFVDHNAKALGWGSASHGGPLIVPSGCPHGDKQDRDGNRVTVLHFHVGANFFRSDTQDGPLFFENEYDPEEKDEGHLNAVHLVWDSNRGVWRWQTRQQLYVDGPKWWLVRREWWYPPPKPPEPPPKPPKRERTGEDLWPLPEEQLVTGEDVTPGGTRTPTGEGVDWEPDDETEDPGPDYIGGTRTPTFVTSSTCMQAPNVAFKATATSTGQTSISTQAPGTATPEQQAAYDLAPQVGYLQGYAKGNGTWDGFSYYEERSAHGHPKAAGGIVVLPPDVTVSEVIAGGATTASVMTIAVPPDLAQIGFGTPDLTTGAVKSGVILEATAAGALNASVVNASGAVTSTKDLMVSAVVGFGDGSLGSLTQSTGTYTDASGRRNYTTYTGNGDSTLAATAMRLLHVLTTGAIILNSTAQIHAHGRGLAGIVGAAGGTGVISAAGNGAAGTAATAGSVDVTWGSPVATGGSAGGGSGGNVGGTGTSGAGGAGAAGANRSINAAGAGTAGTNGAGAATDTAGANGGNGGSASTVAAAISAQISASELEHLRANYLGGSGASAGGAGGGGGLKSAGVASGAGAAGAVGSQVGVGIGTGGAGAQGTDGGDAAGGGGGGASGASGGMLIVDCGGALTLATGARITARGSAGGDGGRGGNAAAGGAGGGGGAAGGGGGGGWVLVRYKGVGTNVDSTRINSLASGGGSGGAGGTGTQAGGTGAFFSGAGEGGYSIFLKVEA